MHAIFINFGNSKIYNPHRLLLNLSDKLKKSDKYVAFSDLSIYYTWKILKSHTKKKKSAPTWNEEFELLDGSYSISDIQDCF